MQNSEIARDILHTNGIVIDISDTRLPQEIVKDLLFMGKIAAATTEVSSIAVQPIIELEQSDITPNAL